MGILQVAMRSKVPYTILQDDIFSHPTLSEALNNLFLAWEKAPWRCYSRRFPTPLRWRPNQKQERDEGRTQMDKTVYWFMFPACVVICKARKAVAYSAIGCGAGARSQPDRVGPRAPPG